MQNFISRRVPGLFAGALALAIFGMAGCSSAPPGAVATVPVKGTLTMDGKPFGPAKVMFKQEEKPGVQPNGVADSTGNIVITTYNAGDGMPVGEYKVYLSPDPMLKTPSHPQIYGDAMSTTLTVSIKASGPNDFKLDMSSSAGPMTSGTEGPPGIVAPSGTDASKSYGPVVGPGAAPAAK